MAGFAKSYVILTHYREYINEQRAAVIRLLPLLQLAKASVRLLMHALLSRAYAIAGLSASQLREQLQTKYWLGCFSYITARQFSRAALQANVKICTALERASKCVSTNE